MSKDNIFALTGFALCVALFFYWGHGFVSPTYFWLFIITAILGLFLAFNIGANDVANAFGTSVGAKTLTLKQALLIAAVFELSGAVFAGGAVTKTIKNGIVSMPKDTDPMLFGMVMLAALTSSGIWIFIATYKSLPVSSTHSIVGGIVGAALAMGFFELGPGSSLAMLDGVAMLKIVASWFISPVMGGIAAYIVFAFIHRKIILPTRLKNIEVKSIKKERKEYKKGYIKALLLKSDEEKEKELAALLENEGEYKEAIEVYKDREKDINALSNIDYYVPIVACLCAATISSMLVFKSLNTGLDLAASLWIILLISIAAHIICTGFVKSMKRSEPNKMINIIFSWFQIFTASAFAFSHGASDISNALGPFLGVLEVLKGGEMAQSMEIPLPAMLAFGIALVAGLWFLGKNVIGTVGEHLATIRPTTGFSAEIASSAVILLATKFGIPVSSTHILIGAVLGIGVFNKDAKWGAMKPIALAWLITLPASALMAAGFFLIFRLIF